LVLVVVAVTVFKRGRPAEPTADDEEAVRLEPESLGSIKPPSDAAASAASPPVAKEGSTRGSGVLDNTGLGRDLRAGRAPLAVAALLGTPVALEVEDKDEVEEVN
jgi:hypothetical protein